MQAHEEIVWAGDTQYGSRGWTRGVLVIMFGGFFVTIGLLASTVVLAAFGLLFMVVGIPLTYQGIKQGGTRFYLTNFRLVRAKNRLTILKTNLPRKESLILPARNRTP
jgi:hypothetical protein